MVDSIGIVTVHDGPSLPPGEIIAPAVGSDADDAELPQQLPGPRGVPAGRRPPRPAVRAADRRHVLHQPLVRHGRDDPQDGRADRLRRRGGQLLRPARPATCPARRSATASAWPRASAACGSGRSARASTRSTPTPAASSWCRRRTSCCTGSPARRETHRYDESLRSIDLVTKDAYEPLLPLSVVVHIDYQRAPSVIQRFGDVKKLITQTLDPMLSAYFRDIAHKKTMLELLHERDEIQQEAREELRQQVPRVRHRVRRRADRQAGHRPKAAARSRRCWSSCGSGSCRSSSSRRTSGSGRRPRSCRR